MANKNRLRELRTDTVINATAKQQESELIKALYEVVEYLRDKFAKRITLIHEKQWYLQDIINELKPYFPDTDLYCHFENTSMKPDGGILAIKSSKDNNLTYPILISEVKNQGTNDLRAKEGLRRQAQGNAIERLGKNLIGFRTALLRESIFPFVSDTVVILRKHPQFWIGSQLWQCLANSTKPTSITRKMDDSIAVVSISVPKNGLLMKCLTS